MTTASYIKIYSGTEIFGIAQNGVSINGANSIFMDDVQIYNNNSAAITLL
jgi:hypothetical protein